MTSNHLNSLFGECSGHVLGSQMCLPPASLPGKWDPQRWDLSNRCCLRAEVRLWVLQALCFLENLVVTLLHGYTSVSLGLLLGNYFQVLTLT